MSRAISQCVISTIDGRASFRVPGAHVEISHWVLPSSLHCFSSHYWHLQHLRVSWIRWPKWSGWSTVAWNFCRALFWSQLHLKLAAFLVTHCCTKAVLLGVECAASRSQKRSARYHVSFFVGGDARCSNLSFSLEKIPQYTSDPCTHKFHRSGRSLNFLVYLPPSEYSCLTKFCSILAPSCSSCPTSIMSLL